MIIREPEDKDKAATWIQNLDGNKAWEVTVKPYKPRRTVKANAYYWGVVLATICQHTGYDPQEMHHIYMGERFGWRTIKVNGIKHHFPQQSSTTLTGEQFGHYIEWVKAHAASALGVLVPDPDEVIT